VETEDGGYLAVGWTGPTEFRDTEAWTLRTEATEFVDTPAPETDAQETDTGGSTPDGETDDTTETSSGSGLGFGFWPAVLGGAAGLELLRRGRK